MTPRTFRRARVAGAVLVGGLAAGVGLRQLAHARTVQLVGRVVAHVDTPDSVVALTFDDGPVAGVADTLLTVLGARGVRATFFVIGGQLEHAPAVGRALVAAGHELGNHTYTHRRMALVSPATVRREVDATDRAIRAAGWRGPILFRPPYGIKLLALPWHLWRAGRTTMTWDVEPDSYPTVAVTPARIVAHVLARVRPGSVVLLHPWYASRATSLAAVGPLVDSLHARGYRVTTAGELLAHASTRARAATHRPRRRSPRGRVSGTTAPQHPPTPSLSLPPMMMQHVHPPVPPPALAAVHAQIGRLEADNRTLRRQRRVAVVHLAPRTTEP